MESEKLNIGKHKEANYSDFPVIQYSDKSYPGFRDSELVEGKILKYERFVGERLLSYKLLVVLGKFQYVIRFGQTSFGHYDLSFYTLSHKYARTNPTPEEVSKLWQSIARLIEVVKNDVESNLKTIRIDPASDSHSVKDIENCINLILEDPKNSYTEDELRKNFIETDIFNYYREITGKNFEVSETQKNPAALRSRLFRGLVKKYLPSWQIVESAESKSLTSFMLERKR
jgi:hypothetical protein